MICGYLYYTTIASFCHERISIRKTLGTGYIGTIELAGIGRYGMIKLLRCQLPYNLQCNRVELQHTAVIPKRILGAVSAARIRNTIASPASVVKHHQVSFSRKTLRYHMEMMLSDDPSKLPQFRGRIEIRTDFPYDLSAFLIQNGKDIRLTAVKDDIVGLKAHIPMLIPFIRAKIAHAVHMQIIADTTVTGTHIRITCQNIFCGLIEAQLIKMIRNRPFP